MKTLCCCWLVTKLSLTLLRPPMDCVARQVPLSLGFSRQEYWSGLPFHAPGYLPNPGIEPAAPATSPALQAHFLPKGIRRNALYS